MRTDAFTVLSDRYDSYLDADPTTKAATRRDLSTDLDRAFRDTTAENVTLLTDANESGMKASANRDFQRNTLQLAQVKEWQAVLERDGQPTEHAKALMASVHDRPSKPGPGTKTFGASPLVLPEATLRELHDAATNKSLLSRPITEAATKAITVTGVPQAAIPQYAVDVFPFLRDRPRLRALIPTEQTDRPSVTYYRGLTAASAAAAVAEGADKPESSPTWESVTVPMTKIAHYGKVNDEVIADYAAWLEVIGGEMIAGVIDAENNMILNGTGTPPQFQGLLNATGIQTQAFSNNAIETVALAATKLRTGAAFTEPDTIVMNPVDWETVTLFRTGGSTTSDGPFLVNPLTTPRLELWGVPVVLTNRIAAGTALVANLKTAAEVYVRQDVTLDVHPGGGGEAEWKANKTLIRAEERIALTVPRPKAIVKATVVSS